MGRVAQYLRKQIEAKGAAYLILIDPDKIHKQDFAEFIKTAEEAGVDGFLVGGSLLFSKELEEVIGVIKSHTTIPTIIFPGALSQIVPNADALLYISLVSGRNPEHLIGKHVLAAPVIKRAGLETLSTGYMLIESGSRTTAEYMSGSLPIPANKPDIAVATALAAQFMGMQFIYLEAGSGAQKPVPFEMVQAVSSHCDIPVIAGGGIRNADVAAKMVASGAKIIVTGNYFEKKEHWPLIKEFAEAVHIKTKILL